MAPTWSSRAPGRTATRAVSRPKQPWRVFMLLSFSCLCRTLTMDGTWEPNKTIGLCVCVCVCVCMCVCVWRGSGERGLGHSQSHFLPPFTLYYIHVSPFSSSSSFLLSPSPSPTPLLHLCLLPSSSFLIKFCSTLSHPRGYSQKFINLTNIPILRSCGTETSCWLLKKKLNQGTCS